MSSASTKKIWYLGFGIGCVLVLLKAPNAESFQNAFTIRKMQNFEKIASLKTIPVPGPTDEILAQFIVDKKVAIQLGKALVWDQAVGSDNKTACASCHFHAGADNRVKNQLNPGQLANDNLFNIHESGPNYVLVESDFPFTTNDISSSQGVYNRDFISSGLNGEPDECKTVIDDVFHVRKTKGGKVNTRKNEQRNTPSFFNSVFYFRNFWDGRAVNTFNGIDPFGLRNEGSYVWKIVKGTLQHVKLEIPTSSLASQASGPPLSGFEMSCKTRLFHNIARKLLDQPILRQQTISKSDSVLAQLSHTRPKYIDLIKKAFRAEFWAGGSVPYAGARVASMDLIDPPIFSEKMTETRIKQIEANFALFFSLAIQMYESTLITDETPFDRFAEGDSSALTEQQKRGLALFNGPAACIFCHTGPEFTSASVRSVTAQRVISVPIPGDPVFHDAGFFNIGVRPTSEDLGVGGYDPFDRPLSETEMIKANLTQFLGDNFDPTQNPTAVQLVKVANDGAFKTPSLRNVELTGPYFHNGGKATLRQVVEFYNRGGDFRNPENFLPPLNLTENQKDDLVAFLLSLTDERVRYKRSPFDHPSLCFPVGHKGSSHVVYNDGEGNAKDIMECIPAVGKQGVSFRNRLKPFMNLDPHAQ